MTISRTSEITVSNSGTSESIFADDASFLFVTSSGWGQATLQVSGNNIDWVDYENSNGVVTFTSNKGIPIYGGLFYRLNVTSYSSPIKFSLYRLMR